jgi:hypothetical protein
MKLTKGLLALRAAIFIAAAVFVVVNLKGYLLNKWGLSINPSLYAIFGFFLMVIVSSLSARKLLLELRADADAKLARRVARELKAGESSTETVHRFPIPLRCLFIILGICFIALPYLGAQPGKSIAFSYAASFGFAFFAFAIAFYMFSYSVTVMRSAIHVNSLGREQEIAFSDVANFRVVSITGGRKIIVTLKNGRKFQIWGRLTGFPRILAALTVTPPHPTA